jgi:flagellar biosynthesis GTPase FlhF
MRAYTQINYNVVALIRQDPAYKKMTSDDVLGRIMNHEMNIQEANNIKNLHMGVSTSKKQDIALKAKKRNKKKKVLIESPSEEKEEEEEEKKKRKKKTMKENMMKMKWFYSSKNSTSSSRREDLTREKGKRSQDQRGCATIAVRMCTSLPNAHMRGRKKTMTRERSLTKATRKIRNTLIRSLMVKPMLAKNGTQVMRVPNRKVIRWQP